MRELRHYDDTNTINRHTDKHILNFLFEIKRLPVNKNAAPLYKGAVKNGQARNWFVLNITGFVLNIIMYALDLSMKEYSYK